jgi:hypothetical protein
LNLVDLEEHLPVNQEYQVEVHAVDPGRLKTTSRLKAQDTKLLVLKVSVKKIGVGDYHCCWEISYGTEVIKSYNHIEHNLEHFEQKTLKVKSVISCYHISEPLRQYLNEFIPAIQQE